MAAGFTTCLWFDTQAEEAAKFYTSVFKDSKIGHIARYPDAGSEIHGRPANSVMTVEFEMQGQRFSTSHSLKYHIDIC
jgi:predicted 3-demethylubiquinone-9 3-methyltransferase (glyoxalase superfamily)